MKILVDGFAFMSKTPFLCCMIRALCLSWRSRKSLILWPPWLLQAASVADLGAPKQLALEQPHQLLLEWPEGSHTKCCLGGPGNSSWVGSFSSFGWQFLAHWSRGHTKKWKKTWSQAQIVWQQVHKFVYLFISTAFSNLLLASDLLWLPLCSWICFSLVHGIRRSCWDVQ